MAMKSLADIAGFGNSPLQKVMVGYSFNLTPNAKDIQDALFSGKEPSGLVEARQYVVNTTQEEAPKQKTTTKFLPPQFRSDEKVKVKSKKAEPSEIDSFDQEDKKMSEKFAKEQAEIDAYNKENKNSKPSESNNSTKIPKEKGDLAETEIKNKKRQEDMAQLLGNVQTDEEVNKYLAYNILLNKGGVNKSMVDLMKKDMGKYINSPAYEQRQANFPEQYIGGAANKYQKNKYETAIAKEKRTQRVDNLNTVPVLIGGDSSIQNYFSPEENKVVLSKDGLPSVAAHELTHSSAKNSKVKKGDFFGFDEMGYPLLPESDRINAKFWDSVTSKKNKTPISAGLNINEMKKFVELAKPTDSEIELKGDIHYDKNSNIRQFSGEQYGDLMGVRNLLYKSGITKSFGEELNKEKLDKALKDKKVNDDPVFKRFLFRYGVDNVIQLNNTIAMNSQSMSNKTSNA